jgi:photosystem II stability/assembly factor-like uncharacterized protein/sugar lactone lactonase YvrE
MKTPIFLILFLLAIWPISLTYAQWQVLDPQLPDSCNFIAWGICVVDENVVWGNPLNNNLPQVEDRNFYKTTDGGQSWTFGVIEEAWSGWWGMENLIALDANTAWAIRNRFPDQDSSEILKTVDGGDVWVHQNLPAAYTALFGIHFFNENEGMVFGETKEPGAGPYPQGWHIDAYYTQDGGDTWLPAALPASEDEGFITASGVASSGGYEALGDRVWFGTSKSRVFRSYDRGKTWAASAPILPGRAIDNVAFRDSLNGIAFSTITELLVAAPKLAFHTNDGGKTWPPLPASSTGWFGWLTDLEFIPGSGGAIWAVSQTNSQLSTDNGNTWVHQETPYLLWFTEFLSPNVGWGGGAYHPTPPTSKLFMYKWVGDSIIRDERQNTTKTITGSGIEGHLDGVSASSRFYNPKGMAIDHGGNVYVADHYNHCIRKIAFDGQISTLAGTGTPGYADGPGASAQFDRPQDVALDTAGNLYVADAGNHVIRKIAPDGSVSLFAGIPGVSGETDGPALQATLGRPAALAIDDAGNLYAGGSNTIRKIDPSGMVSTIHTAAGAIEGLDADRYGNIYFSDSTTLKVQKLSPGGMLTDLAGGGSGCEDGIGAAAKFGGVEDLDADDFGNVYVADGINGRIRKIDPTGKVITLAGDGCLNGYGLDRQPVEGSGDLAQLGRVRGLLLKPGENLLVTSWDNDMVREIRLGSLPAKPITVISSSAGPLYKSMPLSQTQPLIFSGVVANYGQDEVYPVQLKVSVWNDGALTWTNNSSFHNILPGSSDTIILGANFHPLEPGIYEIRMNYHLINPVFFSFREEITVSDSILAVDDGLPYLFDHTAQAMPSFGQIYELIVPDTLTGFSMTAELEDASFYFSVYKMDGDEPGALVYRSDTVLAVSNSYPFGYYHRLPLSLALPAGKFLFAVTQLNPEGAFGMGVDTDRNDQSAWYLSPDEGIGQWTPLYSFWGEETAPVYMLRPVFGIPGTTVSKTKEVAATELSVQIAPNPVAGQLFVKINAAPFEIFTLRLVDAQGKVVLGTTSSGGATANLDISGLPSGMYALRVSGNKGMEVFKVMKQ